MLFVGGYALFLWLSYLDETLTQGSGYGFHIGTSPTEVYRDMLELQERNPNLKIYLVTGEQAGDNATLTISKASFDAALNAKYWMLLLDGDGEFFNVIRLSIAENKLISIHRHRQYFELP